jgi:colanic acid/amylovoran biosynthesis glycosyltransferase
MAYHPNSLVLVIPCVVDAYPDRLELDGDFVNNLNAYLEAFSRVHVMCVKAATHSPFPSAVPLADIRHADRLKITVLPDTYREDLYLRHRRRVRRILREAILESEYHLISPHAAFDWSTMATEICHAEGIPYNMEADWALPVARAELWRRMPWGPAKLRKLAWGLYHDRKYYRALARSSLSLLQGGDVFHELGHRAPNAFSVLNVQMTQADHITAAELARKLDRPADRTIRVAYAGRASDMKGPFIWLDVVSRLKAWGCRVHATWAGEGEELDAMRRFVADRDLADVCTLAGKLERDQTRLLMKDADIFMFCHLIQESPRCLVEALALGTPIVGFDSHYARGLVAAAGGGVFVPRGDGEALAGAVRDIVTRPDSIRELTAAAAASGAALDRDTAMQTRIRLMKTHLRRGGTPGAEADADALSSPALQNANGAEDAVRSRA